MNDPIQFAKQVADLVRDQVSRATAPLIERITQLEARPAPLDGKDGTSVDADQVQRMIGAALPEVANAVIARHFEENPIPASIAGKDGADGKDGASVTVEDVLPMLMAAIPDPVPGKDGTSVTLEDVKGLLESHLAAWALDFERRAQDVLQRAIDRQPAPKDGKDATPLSEFDLVVDEDARTVTLTMGTAEGSKSVTRKVSWLLDRGIYTAGKSYERGDTVSWGGNLWVAQADGVKSMPTENESAWRLAVRKGRDGRNGVDRSAVGQPVKLT